MRLSMKDEECVNNNIIANNARMLALNAKVISLWENNRIKKLTESTEKNWIDTMLMNKTNAKQTPSSAKG